MIESVAIICVDDDPAMLRLYQQIIGKRYPNIRVFVDGQEALTSYRADPAAVMLIDMEMPHGMSGLELTRTIRTCPDQHETAVIVVSAHENEACIVDAYSAGADDYIVKPIKPSELLAKISVAYNKKITTASRLIGVFPGTVFAGRYEIVERLGSGSFGVVYHARDIRDENRRDVALKIFDLPPSKISDQKFMALFLREAYGLSRLDNPNIVKLYDFGTVNFYYLAMEYLKGVTLEEQINKTGPMTEDDARIAMYEIAKILRYLDENKLLHRDIKPVNIMITDTGYLKLLDFGLARSENEETIIGDDVFKGTPEYASPESIYGDPDIGIKSDLYSLGATVYFAVTGKPPFSGGSPVQIIKSRVDADPPPVESLNASLSPAFSSLINRVLAHDHCDRPDVDEVIHTIKNLS